MIKRRNLKFNTRIYNSYFYYKLRLLRCRHYQRVFYKLVVVNRYNSILDHLGFYNPFAVNFHSSYYNISKPLFFAKVFGIDKLRVMSWIVKGAFATPIVSILLSQMGLFKIHSCFRTLKYQKAYFQNRNDCFRKEDLFTFQLLLFKGILVGTQETETNDTSIFISDLVNSSIENNINSNLFSEKPKEIIEVSSESKTVTSDINNQREEVKVYVEIPSLSEKDQKLAEVLEK